MAGSGTQFWDTSALISLLIEERHSAIARKAMESGGLYLAWEWVRLEAYSALTRRGATIAEFKALANLLTLFQFLSLDAGDYPDIQTILQKHRLRTADAGHLFCLKKAKKFKPDVVFICFDDELAKAAGNEGMDVFG
jgi:predicted nucleic acid-binding protein